jgi:hypothetical protein
MALSEPTKEEILERPLYLSKKWEAQGRKQATESEVSIVRRTAYAAGQESI